MEEITLAISALQHYAFCPRQFALIHVEQAWAENHFTAEGKVLHERVDSGESETRGLIRSERGIRIQSEKWKLTGKMDLLEIHQTDPIQYFPVEYKRGKPKVEDWDRIQLCAQALCLEEMRNIQITAGAIWYWEVRKREHIIFNEALRHQTMHAIDEARTILAQGSTPPPIKEKKRCQACSLFDLCEPDIFRHDHSDTYTQDLFTPPENLA